MTGGASLSAAVMRRQRLPSVPSGRVLAGADPARVIMRSSGPNNSSGSMAMRMRHGYGTMAISSDRNSASPASRV